jgi:hypothetical protein
MKVQHYIQSLEFRLVTLPYIFMKEKVLRHWSQKHIQHTNKSTALTG